MSTYTCSLRQTIVSVSYRSLHWRHFSINRITLQRIYLLHVPQCQCNGPRRQKNFWALQYYRAFGVIPPSPFVLSFYILPIKNRNRPIVRFENMFPIWRAIWCRKNLDYHPWRRFTHANRHETKTSCTSRLIVPLSYGALSHKSRDGFPNENMYRLKF